MSESLPRGFASHVAAEAPVMSAVTANAELEAANVSANAKLEAIEARSITPEVNQLNNIAQSEIWGTGGRIAGFTDPSDPTGQTSLAAPIEGVVNEIRENSDFGSRREREAQAKAYENDVDELINGESKFELCQAKLIMDLRMQDKASSAKMLLRYIAKGMSMTDAAEKVTNVYNNKDKERQHIIKKEGIFTPAEYIAKLKSSTKASKVEKTDADTEVLETKPTTDELKSTVEKYSKLLQDPTYVPTAEEYKEMLTADSHLRMNHKDKTGQNFINYTVTGSDGTLRLNAFAARTLKDGIQKTHWLLGANNVDSAHKVLDTDVKDTVAVEALKGKRRAQDRDLLTYDEFTKIYTDRRKKGLLPADGILLKYKDYVSQRLAFNDELLRQTKESGDTGTLVLPGDFAQKALKTFIASRKQKRHFPRLRNRGDTKRPAAPDERSDKAREKAYQHQGIVQYEDGETSIVFKTPGDTMDLSHKTIFKYARSLNDKHGVDMALAHTKDGKLYGIGRGLVINYADKVVIPVPDALSNIVLEQPWKLPDGSTTDPITELEFPYKIMPPNETGVPQIDRESPREALQRDLEEASARRDLGY